MPAVSSRTAGEAIWEALSTGARLTMDELVDECGYASKGSIHQGLRYLRQDLAGQAGNVVCIRDQDSQRYEYVLTSDAAEGTVYTAGRIHDAAARLTVTQFVMSSYDIPAHKKAALALALAQLEFILTWSDQ